MWHALCPKLFSRAARLHRQVDTPRQFDEARPSSDADRKFIAELREKVTQWHALTAQETLIVAVDVGAFHRALAYTELEKLRLGGEGGWKGFQVKRAGGHVADGIMLMRSTKAQADAAAAAERLKRIAAIKVRVAASCARC